MYFFRNIFLFALFLMAAVNAVAQEDTILQISSTLRQIAHRQIRDLHNGVLILRLNTKKKQIENYRNAGNEKIAKKIEDEMLIKNELLLKYFYSYYDFSKLYFVKTDDIIDLKSGDTAIVYDASFSVTQKIVLNEDSVFYVDYGILFGEEIADNIPGSRITRKESMNIADYDALVIKDIYNKQLLSPMPYYSIGLIKNLDLKVQLLSKKLWEYYYKVKLHSKESIDEEGLANEKAKQSALRKTKAMAFFYNLSRNSFLLWQYPVVSPTPIEQRIWEEK